MSGESILSIEEIETLARDAALDCGASEENACALAASIASAEAEGMRSVGLFHFIDYCEGLKSGRIDGLAEPQLENPTPLIFKVDAKSGLAHPGYDRVHDDLVRAAKQFGMAAFSLRNGFTCGAVGYFVSRLASEGLVALAAANAGPAAMSAVAGSPPVFSTNPLAFAVPGRDGPAFVVDQSSSATALVNIRTAQEQGKPLPEGWALDSDGNPTTDPKAALEGALLAFGGYRGTNIALMVEMLAAGLTGANWSADAPSFNSGDESPDVGLFIIVLDPGHLFGEGFEQRVEGYLNRFQSDYGGRLPGAKRKQARADSGKGVAVPDELLGKIRSYLN